MTKVLGKADFSSLLNERFAMGMREGTLELELVEIVDHDSQGTECFSLMFRGPLEKPFPQGSYSMEHVGLGQFPLFLVPVAREPNGMRYEALFNLIIR